MGTSTCFWAGAALSAFASVGLGQAYQIGTNFTGSSLSDSGFIPPDTMGAVGPGEVVELINGTYAVYNKSSGSLITRTSLNTFWNNAFAGSGVAASTSSSFDPRILYDASSSRWFAVAVDNARNASSRVLVAVSNSSSPTSGWRGYTIDPDSTNTRWADFPTIGLNAQGLYISNNMFSVSTASPVSTLTSQMVVNKSSLIGGSLVQTTFENQNPNNAGFTVQPIVDYDGGSLPVPLLSAFSNTNLKRSNVVGTINSPAIQTSGGNSAFINIAATSAPPTAPQPLVGSGAQKQNLNTGDTRFSGNVVLQGGDLWGVQSTAVNGRAAIRWYRIRESDNVVLDTGDITDPNLALYFPSLAVNETGDVVIGFSASSSTAAVSSYAVVGDTVGLDTTFTSPILLKAGVDDYQRLDGSGRNRWGDYSATVLDPSDPNAFWTFQEFVSGDNVWSIQATQILVPEPGMLSLAALAAAGLCLRRRARSA